MNFLLLLLFFIFSDYYCWGSEKNILYIAACPKEISSVLDIAPHEKIQACLDDIRRQIYDTLYEVDNNGELQEALASCNVQYFNTDIDFNVEMDIVCSIKNNIYFSDGNILSINDVIYSIERLKKSTSLSSSFAFINSITGTADNKIKFSIKKEKSQGENFQQEYLFNKFKYLLAKHGYIVRQKYFEGSSKWALEYPVGTGPFYFENWKLWDRRYLRSEVILVKNVAYWKKDFPKVDKVVFRFLPSDLWIEHFEKHSLSLVPRLSFKDFENLSKNSKIKNFLKINRRLFFSYQYLIFNEKSNILKNSKIKEAVGLGINRKLIVNSVLNGNAYVNTDKTLEASVVYPDVFKDYEYNPTVSRLIIKKYLKQNKIKGDKLKLSVLLLDSLEENLIAEKLKQMLYSAGIELVLIRKDAYSYGTILNNKSFKNYDLVLLNIDENPKWLNDGNNLLLKQGGIQLYQKYLFYAFSRNLKNFSPPAEGGIFLLKSYSF